MALWKGEGHSIYILKSPSLEDLSQRSTNVIFLQNPGIGPCRAIPLEQLTKGASGRNCSKGMDQVPCTWSHEVEDDVVECETIQEERCEDETSGYTTFTKCSKWPREVCDVRKNRVTKYTPITGCTKEPRELCAPAGCGFKEVMHLDTQITHF